ncbi:hypothetical protein LSUE1_G006382 [Lachnellula suecica]|uniref:Hydrophobic surface binding protein n=1 Tax=Lachnellula suecica TaxID=602035 RepID=A0A8T9C236_9HELO|nr:hypothetical protein LSUE1_G006382 [Lachnellula suecica]
MVAVQNILLFVATASALAIGKRDASTILSDISTIDSDVKALTSALNSYSGGLFGALPINTAESNLDDAINQGTKDAQATTQQDSADSQMVITAINNLIPDIEAALTATENKKSQLAAAGLTSTIQGDLKTLKTDTDSFSDALIAIASSDTVAQGTSQKATIDADFTSAINDFA